MIPHGVEVFVEPVPHLALRQPTVRPRPHVLVA